MNKRGFTLVELLIVVGIIGVLAAIAIPGYLGQQRRAARSEASTNLQNLSMLLAQRFADSGSYVPTAYCRSPFTVIAPAATLDYKGSSALSNAQIEDYFCGFSPAGLDSPAQFDALVYTYKLTNLTATTYTATAVAKDKRRATGDADCTINQDNTRIGPCW